MVATTLVAATRRALLLILIALGGACARATSEGSSRSEFRPPAIAGRYPRFEFTTPVRGVGEFSVIIQADGTPDLRSLQLSGVLGESHRGTVELWIAQTSFRPATQFGRPIAARFVWKSDLNSKGRGVPGTVP
jgi:hypothetical protein